jgi:hypothetical protein
MIRVLKAAGIAVAAIAAVCLGWWMVAGGHGWGTS